MGIKNAKEKCITLAMIGAVVAVLWLFRLPCPILALTGIPCPGCGMTRAYLSLLQGDVAAAFSYNAMFWAVPLMAAQYLWDGALFRRRALDIVLTAVIYGGLFVCWIVKLIG